jgi:ATP-binding cassette subfamily B protein
MSALRLLRRTLLQVRPFWPHIGLVLFLSLLATPLALMLPLPLKIVVDSYLGDHALPGFLTVFGGGFVSKSALLGFAVALFFVVTLLNLLLTLATDVLREYVGERIVLNFRSRLFEQSQQLSLAFHDTQGVSHSLYRIQWDAPAVRWLLIDGMLPLVVSVVTLTAVLVVTVSINAKLALIGLLVAPILAGLTYLYSRTLRRRWSEVQSVESSAFGVVQEVLGALRVVNAFGQEQRERERFLRQSLEGLSARVRAAWMNNSLGLWTGLAIAVGTATVLYVGARDVQAGVLTVGELLLIMAYLAQLYSPLQAAGRQIADQQRSLVGMQRAFELLDQTPAVAERAGARPLGRVEGSVVFRDVSFGYDDAKPVLRDLSFDVPAGTSVGIMGPTGAGKTTLLSLLIRFYDPARGQVTLDGIDLRDCKLQDLRKQFGIVLQEPVLFSTTIAENIAYAKPSASRDEIVAAAQSAHAHDFITAMPDGYETIVGERGMRLSGGERQRISLARAFLKDAPLLILDEPTSSVDMATEAVIMQALERLMRGRTTFMIAHRLSTLARCDLLLRIENGVLAEVISDVSTALGKINSAAISRIQADA